MTLGQFAVAAIRRAVRLLPRWRDPLSDARIAAWIVWSERDRDLSDTDRKKLNKCRRVLQRAGIRNV